jgi:hypothetical protein
MAKRQPFLHRKGNIWVQVWKDRLCAWLVQFMCQNLWTHEGKTEKLGSMLQLSPLQTMLDI